jgi:hypothetical protein
MDFCIAKQTLNIKQQMYLYNNYVMKNVYTQKVMSIFMYVCMYVCMYKHKHKNKINKLSYITIYLYTQLKQAFALNLYHT